MVDEEYETYLFEYPFNGSYWAFHLKARDFDEAEARLKALPWARLKGTSKNCRHMQRATATS